MAQRTAASDVGQAQIAHTVHRWGSGIQERLELNLVENICGTNTANLQFCCVRLGAGRLLPLSLESQGAQIAFLKLLVYPLGPVSSSAAYLVTAWLLLRCIMVLLSVMFEHLSWASMP